MYCKHCAVEVANDNAYVCLKCGGLLQDVPQAKPKFYTAGFVLGILSLCLGPWGPILGLIGLPMACISKRKSAIIMNIIGIVAWVAIYGSLIISSRHTFRDFDHEAHIEQTIEILHQTLDARQEAAGAEPYTVDD